ncbi:MAG: hypothetical protein CO158_06260 [Piscirickettsiaceae bacterium CG_4_9_14_3_um_filter_43_564]|nr:DUF2066 domain-containing protein [Thiomicrospira sp.]OIP93634.1 MAG: hypothetical protein AUK56_11255 [Thiomicrospira sp. CG2_30_44_34]PIQ02860.1 MAG: hypothetical protein COW74_09405 [Piscirickettsiaceae bacterium CG18_big_fil_WC_8_21_14_2_50_44_103]PIU39137.1 MAG: hypothetical protein COT01_03040 [Piscirickettsiaceae bacterium CG07_land_8_20_14_0_80_44_28]PIW58622.1 MAG: hypothetical protein COW14_00440 [Piscirickettsiaceae bacterium CG12_big_fil_rev_8_21_14_0_65_44_934]PIW76868.1 MAG: h
MRSFLLRGIFIAMGWCLQGYALAESSVVERKPPNLFEIKVLQEDGESVRSTASFDAVLQDAMKRVLTRLTGSEDILKQADVINLLNQPKTWLKSYRYEPYEIEGVKVGTYLIFQFDEGRLYQTFQKHGWVSWPYQNRPTTLVMGSRLMAGTLVKLTSQNLDYAANMDFRHTAEQLGLPIELDDTGQTWVYPEGQNHSQAVADRMQSSPADYLLSFQVESLVNGRQHYKWQLFSRSGESVIPLVKDMEFDSANRFYDQVFLTLIQAYSATYRQQADFLGAVTLRFENIDSAAKITRLETLLRKIKPMVHQVKLMSLKGTRATFEADYQGSYTHLLARLQAFEFLKLVDDNALIGRIDFQWQVDDSGVQ